MTRTSQNNDENSPKIDTQPNKFLLFLSAQFFPPFSILIECVCAHDWRRQFDFCWICFVRFVLQLIPLQFFNDPFFFYGFFLSVNKRLSRSIDRKLLQYKLVNIYGLQCFRKLHVCIACWCVCPYPFTYGAFFVKLQNWHILIFSSIIVCFFKIWHIQSLLLDDEMKSILQEKDRENHTTINLYIVYAMHSLYYFIRVHLSLSVKKFCNEKTKESSHPP